MRRCLDVLRLYFILFAGVLCVGCDSKVGPSTNADPVGTWVLDYDKTIEKRAEAEGPLVEEIVKPSTSEEKRARLDDNYNGYTLIFRSDHTYSEDKPSISRGERVLVSGTWSISNGTLTLTRGPSGPRGDSITTMTINRDGEYLIIAIPMERRQTQASGLMVLKSAKK